MKQVDLHVHSNHSLDGELPVSKLLKIARKMGIEVIAIADHNVVSGTIEAMTIAPADLIVIPAVEFDCYFQGENIHIIGYGIDPLHPDIQRIVNHYGQQDRVNSTKMIEAVNRLGLGIHLDEVLQYVDSEIIAGEDIARALLEHPVWSKHPFMEPYHAGGSRADAPLLNFFFDYFAQGMPASVPYDYFDYRVIVQAIHASGGKAVLAHPGRYGFLPAQLPGRDSGLDGWEIYSAYHTPEIEREYAQVANRQGLIATCGSDFHGHVKPGIEITVFESEAADLLLA